MQKAVFWHSYATLPKTTSHEITYPSLCWLVRELSIFFTRKTSRLSLDEFQR